MRNVLLNFDDEKKIEELSYALSSSYRLKILKLLTKDSYSIQELAAKLDLAMSTISFHIKILKEAGLIKVLPAPSKKGNEKNISLNVETIFFAVSSTESLSNRTYFLEIPIGSFSNHHVVSPCAMCSDTEPINPFDDPIVFDSLFKSKCELLSFSKGWLEYSILTHEFKQHKLNSITFSMELCSECPNYNNDWKSDITFWINNIEIATYRSKGDYGGRRGILTPQWWPFGSTQYGMLINLTIDNDGTFINGEKINNISLRDINIAQFDVLKFKIGIKENARYIGGINLFGKKFGDYNQAINFIVDYETIE